MAQSTLVSIITSADPLVYNKAIENIVSSFTDDILAREIQMLMCFYSSPNALPFWRVRASMFLSWIFSFSVYQRIQLLSLSSKGYESLSRPINPTAISFYTNHMYSQAIPLLLGDCVLEDAHIPPSLSHSLFVKHYGRATFLLTSLISDVCIISLFN